MLLNRQKKPAGPTARSRAKRRRAEAPVAKRVRAECVERDGYCLLQRVVPRDVIAPNLFPIDCNGPSEWCHMHDRRRSKTRNMAPEIRHDSAYTFMGCQRHHDQYDGRQGPRLFITALTRAGANGPVKIRI